MQATSLRRTLFASGLALLTATAAVAQVRIPRKPLSLNLFLRPFKPQTVTPQIFGLLPENEYLQKEVKLTAAQMQRMREIEIQLTRVSTVLRHKDVEKALGVSKTQLKRIDKLGRDAREEARKLVADLAKKRKTKKKPTRKELAAIRKQAEDLEAEFEKSVLKELSGRQREKLAKLKGKPIDVKQIFNRTTMLRLQPGSLKFYLFEQPFEPQDTTPKVFGMLPDIEYLQDQLKVTAIQKKRMREVEIQLTRPSSLLLDEDVRESLSISRAQMKRMHKAGLELARKDRELMAPFGKRFLKIIKTLKGDEKKKAIEKLQAEMRIEAEKRKALPLERHKALMGVLTKQQREKLEKLKGRPIEPDKIFNLKKAKSARPDV